MKQFIKITSELKPKNKAHELAREHLRKLDKTLHPGIHSAKLAVNIHFKEALKKYNGRATRPELKWYEYETGTQNYYVDGLIYLSIYTVKEEF